MDLATYNDDVLTEILVRLPAKSLIRLKSVCKKWFSLISSDYFCHQHTLRRPKLQPSLILKTWLPFEFWYMNPTITINGEKKMIPLSLNIPQCEILQACNGLMLLELEISISNPKKISYLIYNPTTRQSREIIMSFYDSEYPLVAIGLAFDPSKSPYYKIVCIRSVGENEDSELYTYQIEVYDSESHTWKLSLEPFIEHSPFDIQGMYGTYWNDAIYWSFNDDEERYYSCFEIGKNELIKTLPFPETPPDFDEEMHSRCVTYLQESDGHLYHIELFDEDESEDDKELVMLVWELVGDDYSQLIFKYHHRLTFTTYCLCYYILRSDGDGDGDGKCSLMSYEAGKIRAYSFVDKSYKDLVDLTAQPFLPPRCLAYCFQFGETLALV